MAVDPITPPSNIGYGTVVFQGASSLVDSADGGVHPDFNALTGTVTFKPTVLNVKDATATPNPITIAGEIVTGTLGVDGYLGVQIDDDTWQAGVELVATNDTDLNPHDWGYTVDYSGLKFASTGRPVGWPSHVIAVPQGETVDLTLVAPVSSTTPIGLAAAEAAAAVAVAAALAAEAAAEAAAEGDVDSINGESGIVTIALTEDPPSSGFYTLEVSS